MEMQGTQNNNLEKIESHNNLEKNKVEKTHTSQSQNLTTKLCNQDSVVSV